MKFPKPIQESWVFIRQVFSKFSDDDAFTWAAALSYYTVFSLPPIILVILYTTTLIYDEQSMRVAIFGEIGKLVGEKSANQLSNTVDTLGVFDQEWWVSAIGIGSMILTSTTVFITLQNALNHIFRVKVKPKKAGWFKIVRDRILSFSVLLGIGFILLVSLVIDALISRFSSFIAQQFPNISLLLLTLTSILIPLFLMTILLALLFKYLPDADISWRYTWAGAIITAILFALGKNAIGYYIGQSQTANLYDAAGSILVIMLWVFYASLIFFLGSVITAIIVENSTKGGIRPASYAMKVEQQEVEVVRTGDSDLD